MDIEIPAVPLGVLVLLNFFAPYATAVAVNPVWPPAWKKAVAIVVALVLAGVVLLVSYFGYGQVIPSWPVLLLTAIIVSQASYDLITGKSADRLARSAGTGSSTGSR